MGALELVFFFGPTTPPPLTPLTTSKSLYRLSPYLRLGPSSFFLSSPTSHSVSPFLQLCPSFRFLPRCASILASDDFNEEEEDDPEEVFEEWEDEEGDEDSHSMTDVETLEEEARDVVREFSSSLSNELRIGAFFWLIFLF